jgi:hypothetical protein
MFDASTFEAWGIVSWRALWSISLCIYCLDVCGSSLYRLEAPSSSVSRVAGSSYIHWDRSVVPAAGCIQGVVLWVSSLVEGSVHIGVSIVPLVVQDIVVSTVP